VSVIAIGVTDHAGDMKSDNSNAAAGTRDLECFIARAPKVRTTKNSAGRNPMAVFCLTLTQQLRVILMISASRLELRTPTIGPYCAKHLSHQNNFFHSLQCVGDNETLLARWNVSFIDTSSALRDQASEGI
jgi:hypothetical protein